MQQLGRTGSIGKSVICFDNPNQLSSAGGIRSFFLYFCRCTLNARFRTESSSLIALKLERLAMLAPGQGLDQMTQSDTE